MAEHDEDVALIRRWFQKLQLCIQRVFREWISQARARSSPKI
jgi:hypothetical protein